MLYDVSGIRSIGAGRSPRVDFTTHGQNALNDRSGFRLIDAIITEEFADRIPLFSLLRFAPKPRTFRKGEDSRRHRQRDEL